MGSLPGDRRVWLKSRAVTAPAIAPALPADEPRWPAADGRRIVFLVDASSPLERRVLERWIARARPDGVGAAACDVVAIPPSRRRRGARLDPRLEATLAVGDDPLLAPLRVAWLPPGENGVRAARLAQLLTLGDPRDPGRLDRKSVV